MAMALFSSPVHCDPPVHRGPLDFMQMPLTLSPSLEELLYAVTSGHQHQHQHQHHQTLLATTTPAFRPQPWTTSSYLYSPLADTAAGLSPPFPSVSWHYVPSPSLSQGRHVCPTCSKAFSRPSSLQTHLHTHTGAKPFLCTYPGCGKAFSVRSNMRRHERGCHNSHHHHHQCSGSGSASPCLSEDTVVSLQT